MNRSKFIVFVLIASVLILSSVVAIPLTNHPDFCGSCHTIKPSVESWKLSSHKEVECVVCHVRPGFRGFIEDKVLAGLKDVAITFIGTPKKPYDLQAHVDSEVCLSCHRAILRVSEIATRDLPKPLKDLGLIMSHRQHMESFKKRGKGEGCTTCHARLVHGVPIKEYPIVIPRGHVKLDMNPYYPDYPEGSVLWKSSLEDCLRCHNNKAKHEGNVLSKKCKTCHISKKIEDYLF